MAKVTSLWSTTRLTGQRANRVSLELYKSYSSFLRVGSSEFIIVHQEAAQLCMGIKANAAKQHGKMSICYESQSIQLAVTSSMPNAAKFGARPLVVVSCADMSVV